MLGEFSLLETRLIYAIQCKSRDTMVLLYALISIDLNVEGVALV